MSEDICGSKEGVGNSVSFNDLPVVVLAEASKTGLVLAALKRLLSTERSLQRRGKLESFQEALQEYSTLGHAEEVPSEELEKPREQHYYLPVHVVFKATSSTMGLEAPRVGQCSFLGRETEYRPSLSLW